MMRYFPAKLGFVFHIVKDNEGKVYGTPYNSTCKNHGIEEVTKVIHSRSYIGVLLPLYCQRGNFIAVVGNR